MIFSKTRRIKWKLLMAFKIVRPQTVAFRAVAVLLAYSRRVILLRCVILLLSDRLFLVVVLGFPPAAWQTLTPVPLFVLLCVTVSSVPYVMLAEFQDAIDLQTPHTYRKQ